MSAQRGLRNTPGQFCAVSEPPRGFKRTHLVVLRGGDQKENGCHTVKAFEPAAPLGALASHIHHLEGHVLDLEVVLVDALSGLPGQEDVLLAGEVVLRAEFQVHVQCWM